jgi:hypothetical protein
VELTYKADAENFSVAVMRHRPYAKDYNAGVSTTFDFKHISDNIPVNTQTYYLADIGEGKLKLPDLSTPLGKVAETLNGTDTERIQLILNSMWDFGCLGGIKKEYLTPEIGEALYRFLVRTSDPANELSKEDKIRRSILRSIGAYKDKRALPYLLADKGDPEVVISLAMMGESAVEPMFLKLQSRDAQEKKDAVGYFKLLLHPKELEGGEICMDFRDTYDPPPALRKRILEAIKKSNADCDSYFKMTPGWVNWERTL